MPGRLGCGKRMGAVVVITSMLVLSLTGDAWSSGLPVVSASTSTDIAYHWGEFFGDQSSSAALVTVPTPIDLPGPVEQIATSNSTDYALLTNGTVYSWGEGQEGQLGNGMGTDSLDTPVQVNFPSGVVIRSLATDAMPIDTAMAIDSQGHAWGWGLDSFGQLRLGNHQEYLEPVQLPFTHVTAIAGAFDHGLYDSAGTVYACGGNDNGDLGTGSRGPSSAPVAVRGLEQGQVTALYASYNNSGALLANGEYVDWGYNHQGELGRGTAGTGSSVPVPVALPARVTQVALGGSLPDNGQTLVALSDGTYWAWGDGADGQLGDGSTANQPAPIQMHPPAGVTYAVLASGGGTSYGVTPSGDVYAWGNGSTGQLGDGGTPREQPSPVKVESGATQISSTANNVATI